MEAVGSGGVYAGGWTVNWSFLCILYRILDEIQPDSILELGLGQTTKLTTSYMKSKLGKHEKKHSIIEHDEEWMNFMKHSIDLSKSELMILALEENRYKEIGWMILTAKGSRIHVAKYAVF